MPWGAVAGAVVGGVVNKALAPKSKLGAGESAQTKEPWAEAAPWLKEQIAQGQALQQQYQAQPFSEQQKQAYANQYAQSDYMRGLVPSLMNQMQNQQVGFNRDDPRAKPTAFNYGLMGADGQAGGLLASGQAGGLLGGSMTEAGARQVAADQQRAAAAAAAAEAAKKKAYGGEFIDQGNFGVYGGRGNLGTGRFGEFQYGQTPDVGSQAYRDMSEYFNFGGADPNNFYGRRPPDNIDRP